MGWEAKKPTYDDVMNISCVFGGTEEVTVALEVTVYVDVLLPDAAPVLHLRSSESVEEKPLRGTSPLVFSLTY